jgi:RNA polymerase sigma factor (sigma-70 family)
MTDPVDDLAPTRGSLLNRLKQWDDHASWQEFFDQYWRLIYHFALRSGLTDAEAQDVVQETVIAVAKSIGRFQHNQRIGAFKNWLLKITRSRIIDRARRNRQHAPMPSMDEESARTPFLERLADPGAGGIESAWDEEWNRNLLQTALDNVRSSVKPKQFQMFDCFVIKEWPMAKVTERLCVNMGQVYFAKYKISALVKKEIRRLEREWNK